MDLLKAVSYDQETPLSHSYPMIGRLINLESTLNYYQTTAISEKSQLDIALNMPFVGYIKRQASDSGANPVLEDDFEKGIGNFLFANSKGSFINPLSRVWLNLKYSYRIGNKMDLVADYSFNYLKHRNNPTITLFDMSLLAGLKFKF